MGKVPFDLAFFGRLKQPTNRRSVTDPFALHSKANLAALRRFFLLAPLTTGCEVRVVTRQVFDRIRQHDEFTSVEQANEAVKLVDEFRSRGVKLNVGRKTELRDHDRTYLWEIDTNGRRRHYRVLLGQGLVAFEKSCRQRSEGVYFAISPTEFEAGWQEIENRL